MRKLSTWLLVALAGGVFVAGCQSNSSSTPPSMSALSPAASVQAMARCQRIVAQSTLSAKAKAQLEEICGLAPSGDQAAVSKCVELVQHLPAGPAIERAIAICRGP